MPEPPLPLSASNERAATQGVYEQVASRLRSESNWTTSASGVPHPQSQEHQPRSAASSADRHHRACPGSGKSSLAFDTLYAEGQRRYVESLSAYARQFLQLMEKPDVDLIEGLSPAISIEQKATSHNPRSTVGTVTEIHDYLRLLFARVGEPYCPDHPEQKLAAMTISQMVDAVLMMPEETRLMILAPAVVNRKGEQAELLRRVARQGFRARPRRRQGVRDRCGAEADQEHQAHGRSRRRPAAHAPGSQAAYRRIVRDGAAQR